MHRPFSTFKAQAYATMAIVADSPDAILNSRSSKSEGYGGLVSIGLILLAIAITILVFFRSRSSRSDSKQSSDHQQDELGEPDDHDLKMR